MTEDWTFLAKYRDCWPVRDMLKMHLKYTSEASRRSKDKAVVERAAREMISAAAWIRQAVRARLQTETP